MDYKEKHEYGKPLEQDYLYKIGMFAAMNHITVKTLRFYEEQGLLYPAHINEENGYRFYTMSQMATVHQISALKMAGFTLDEIAKINAGTEEDVIIHAKKSELLHKIAELTKQVSILDGYLAEKKGALLAPVLVKTLPEVTCACMTQRIESYDRLFDLMPKMGQIMEEAGCECALPEYCFTNYIEPDYKEEDILIETCEAVVKAQEEREGLYFKTFPETTAACIFHKGTYATLAKSYEAVLRFVEENSFEIAGPIRENYIDGVWNKEDESQWLTEIQVPISKKQQCK